MWTSWTRLLDIAGSSLLTSQVFVVVFFFPVCFWNFYYFFQFYWGKIDKWSCHRVEVLIGWFGTHIHCKKIPAIKLINTCITSGIFFVCACAHVCVFVWEREQLSSPLLVNVSIQCSVTTVVLMLYIRSSELTHFVTQQHLYHLISLSPLPHSPAPDNYHSVLRFYEFNFVCLFLYLSDTVQKSLSLYISGMFSVT